MVQKSIVWAGAMAVLLRRQADPYLPVGLGANKTEVGFSRQPLSGPTRNSEVSGGGEHLSRKDGTEELLSLA